MAEKRESTLWLDRISSHYDDLSATEKKVADYFIANREGAVDMAVAALAEAIGVSQATIVRFCRRLGFKGVAEFKVYLGKEHLSDDVDYLDVDEGDSEMVIARKVTKFNKEAIDDTMTFLDKDALKSAVDVLDAAKQVIIVAEGGSASTARSIYDSFLQIGIPCTIVTDATFQVYVCNGAKPEDAVIAVCHSGRSRNVVDAMRLAKEAGAATIAILGAKNSPLAKCSDIQLYTGLSSHPYYSEKIAARIWEMNVVAALHAILSLRNKGRLKENNMKINQLLEMKRI